MLTARALLVRLRIVVLSTWLAPLALFSAFAALAPLPPRDTTQALFGPATVAALVGWALAATVWLPRVVGQRCIRVETNEIVRGLRTLARTAAALVCGSILFTCAIVFYASGMHVRVRANEVAVLAACGVLYAVLLAVPLYLAGADLIGRYFGPRLHGAALLPMSLRDAALAGGVATAGAMALVFCAVVTPEGVRADVVFAACALFGFSMVVGRLAHRGTVHAMAPLHVLRDAIPAARVEAQSLDTLGTLVAELAERREHDREVNARAATVVAAPIVLVVADDPATIEDGLHQLRSDGHPVLIAHAADEALRVLDAEPVDVALIDAALDLGMCGIDLVERIRERHPRVLTLLIADASLADRERARAAALGAPVLQIPVDPHELSRRVASALAHGGSNARNTTSTRANH